MMQKKLIIIELLVIRFLNLYLKQFIITDKFDMLEQILKIPFRIKIKFV